MNSIIIILSLIVSINCFNFNDKDMLLLFEKFINKYKKIYLSSEDFNKRLDIFSINIIEHAPHLLYNTEDDPQMSPFLDLTPEEFESQYLTLKTQDLDVVRSNIIGSLSTKLFEDIPTSFDWRDHGAVTSVKTEGRCGSCWAFSVAANIEGLYKIQSGKLIDFSVSQLIDCDKYNNGCDGGRIYRAIQWLSENGGLNTENDYPYISKKRECKFKKDKFRVKVDGFLRISQNEEYIAYHLTKIGPLIASINGKVLQFYFGGIFDPTNCNPESLNRAVNIVGYGEENGKKFWIVKNDLGKGFGEAGYFRIIRGVGKCGINLNVMTAVLDKQ